MKELKFKTINIQNEKAPTIRISREISPQTWTQQDLSRSEADLPPLVTWK